MNINDVKIPVALQLVLDDVGWMDGMIPYWDGWNPNRTGMPRKHVLEDYIALNEIGRAIGMKINGMFVIGEWDRKNILRKVPCATKYGDQWDHSQFLDAEEAEKIRDYLNTCEYLELGIHGLMHEAWDKDGEYLGGEFIVAKDFKPGNPLEPVPEWYLRSHLDAFMEIYNDWGFTQKLRTFTSPGYCKEACQMDFYTKTLKEYGVQFWHNGDIDPKCFVKNDIILNKKMIHLAFWEAYDLNPAKLPTYDSDNAGIISGHWPNLLRYDPDENLKRVDAWKAFFERQAEVFGLVISRDIAMAHHQLLYKNYAVVDECDGRIRIDLAKVDEMAPAGAKEPLYISVKNGSGPVTCEGGVMTEYESHKEFKTYKIERTDASVVYLKS